MTFTAVLTSSWNGDGKQFLVLRRNLLMNVSWRCIFAEAQRALAAAISQEELLTLRFVT